MGFQVDLHAICSTVPLPLNQGVPLALLQQLAYDTSNETSRKVGWMIHVAVAINPTDPMIMVHVRRYLSRSMTYWLIKNRFPQPQHLKLPTSD
ncbi:hypothetical protein COCNU_14G002900 [Cocos nucifera]|uniref:Enhancer of mRNA-decapping protein 4 C-terminal domain-containing protein n=1 Tax=Cocos nucifera TaxID=13894 RepID=A0A8K0IU86_COCNU|nr:hypothetical protein COCNU_14G002900 [Cocos nucifera]